MRPKVLECVVCAERHSADDVLRGDYQVDTFVCSACYAAMQRKPHEKCCFGKPTLVLLDGSRALGYDPEAEECRRACPDRKPCRRIVMHEPPRRGEPV